MAAGDGFSASQRHEIDKAIRDAEILCRIEFSVFVGRADGEPRHYAERLHAALTAPDRSVLVLVDPAAKQLEIVTGEAARRVLEDAEVRLAALTMQTAFAAGDLVGGITRGVLQLAEHARRPQLRHGG
ncbi:MAG: TPM domain-containing protein [Nocardioidaceae bacterium]